MKQSSASLLRQRQFIYTNRRCFPHPQPPGDPTCEELVIPAPPQLKGVCFLVTDLDSASGGIQRNSRLLLKELNARGIATYACVRNYHGLPGRELINGTAIHRSPIIRDHLALNAIIYFVWTLFWLIRNHRKYDLIHCQQMFGSTMVATVASYFVNKPVITRVTLSGECGELAHLRAMPLVRFRTRLLKRVTCWVALSREMKNELIGFGIPANAIRIIHNSAHISHERAFDAEMKMRVRNELALGRGKIAIFVGRLAEEKNLPVLVHAWRRVRETFPEAQLLLLGAGGEYRSAELPLKDLVSRLKLDTSVHFLGHVSEPDKYLLACDTFVLPTQAEGLSNALVEAFACGAAIIATDIPANTEICVDRINSLLVPVGDSRALAAAIVELFGNPDLAKRFGAAARKKAEEELTVDQMLAAYFKVYGEALVSSERAKLSESPRPF